MVKTINETKFEDLLDLDIIYKNVKYAKSVDYDLKKLVKYRKTWSDVYNDCSSNEPNETKRPAFYNGKTRSLSYCSIFWLIV